MGKGAAINPEEGLAVSPVDGTVVSVFDTKHAIGIATDDGIELLIHIGVDTVNMKGKGFTQKCEVGQKVKAGDPLMEFDIEEIKKAGYENYFVDHTAGVYPTSASGSPWNAAGIGVKGDVISDLTEDMAADALVTDFGLSKSGDYLFITDAYFGLVAQMDIPAL